MVESFLPAQNSTVDLLRYSLLVLPSGVRDEDVDLFGGHHPADHSSLEVALSDVLNSTLTQIFWKVLMLSARPLSVAAPL